MRASKFIKTGLLGGIAGIMMIFLQVPYPPAHFIKYEPSDIAAIIGTFAMGPLAGVAVVFVKDLIFIFLKGGEGFILGVLMDFIAGATFAIVAGVIYRRKKTRTMAVFALLAGTIAMTAIMIPANYIVLPLFMKPQMGVISFILFLIVPFNLIKGLINSILVFLVYKRISHFLKSEKMEQTIFISSLQKE